MSVHEVTGISLPHIVSLEQPRIERASAVVRPKIQAFGGAEVVQEIIQIGDITGRIAGTSVSSYGDAQNPTVTTQRVVGEESAFTTLDQFGRDLKGSMSDIFQALFKRAETIAIRRSHCVEITLTVPAGAALGLSLRDRVKLADRRLAGGELVGKITGLEISFGASETATITLSCPISETGSTRDTAQLGGAVSLHDGTGSPSTTDAMQAMAGNGDAALVTSVTVSGAADEQLAEIAPNVIESSNPDPSPNPDVIGSVTKTSVSIDLADLNELPAEELGTYEVLLSRRDLELPKGVNLS